MSVEWSTSTSASDKSMPGGGTRRRPHIGTTRFERARVDEDRVSIDRDVGVGFGEPVGTSPVRGDRVSVERARRCRQRRTRTHRDQPLASVDEVAEFADESIVASALPDREPARDHERVNTSSDVGERLRIEPDSALGGHDTAIERNNRDVVPPI
jgi:hypothetical protein